MEFPDGEIKQYYANIIAENMNSQVNAEGYSRSLIESIFDYKKNGNAVPSMKGNYVNTRLGQQRMRKKKE